MAMADGGLLASSWWLIGRLLRLDVYYFLVRDLASYATASSLGRSQSPEFLKLTSLNDLAKAGPVLRNTLSLHSGRSPDIVINDGGAMYAFRNGASVCAQLNVQLSPISTVDTPIPMQICAAEDTAFLSFLYTYPEYRGRSMARKLIAATSHDLERMGLKRFLTHVSASNIPSLLAFKAAGWQKAGLIITSKKGQIVWTRKLEEHGVLVSELHHPTLPR